MFHSDRQTQTNISSSNLQELDCTTVELCKLSNTIDKIQKDTEVLQHNIAAQQASWEFLNRHIAENLQTIVDAVHQLVHIAQNTQDNTQTTTQKTSKFQETTQANSLMALEITRRNARRLPIIQESIQRINTILDELTQEEPQPTDTPNIDQMPELEDIPQQDSKHKSQLRHAKQQDRHYQFS